MDQLIKSLRPLNEFAYVLSAQVTYIRIALYMYVRTYIQRNLRTVITTKTMGSHLLITYSQSAYGKLHTLVFNRYVQQELDHAFKLGMEFLHTPVCTLVQCSMHTVTLQ